MSNLRPKEKQLETVTSDDKHLLYFFIHNVKINLPITSFNFLMEMVVTSREEIILLIQYRRVISEFFSQLGIIKRIKKEGLTAEVEWSQKFEYVE